MKQPHKYSERLEGHITYGYKCPKCGSSFRSDNTLYIGIEEYEGNYCLKCLAKWISENIPKLIIYDKP